MQIESGLSGGPVFDPATGYVYGLMVTQNPNQLGGYAESAAFVLLPFFEEVAHLRVSVGNPDRQGTGALAAASPAAVPSPAAARTAVATPAPRATATSTPVRVARRTGTTIRIPVIADLTGAASAAGIQQRNAYQLAAEDIAAGLIDAAGATVTFDVQDGKTNAAQATAMMRRLASDPATPLILGPTEGSEGFGAYPVAVAANLPVLATSIPNEGLTAIGPAVYRVSLADSQSIPALVATTLDRWHYRAAAIIYDGDVAFTRSDGILFQRELLRQGTSVVDFESVHTRDRDFADALNRIAAKKPDVIAIGALLPEAVRILKQIAKLGIRAKLMGGTSLYSLGLHRLTGAASEGLAVSGTWFGASETPGNRTFIRRYRERFGAPPLHTAAEAYAAAQVVAAIVRGGATSRADFAAALGALAPVQTVLGPLTFTENHDVKLDPVILQITKSGFAQL